MNIEKDRVEHIVDPMAEFERRKREEAERQVIPLRPRPPGEGSDAPSRPEPEKENAR